ncbi:MAG: hypothetical protein CSYNP_03927 [Syntrophus sp. SKADARSKE-3]|nr:hypothetical protein [Syntrophus sp. SKADARSKE-3]
MKPIGPLMWEHRLIEKMLRLVGTEIKRMQCGHSADPILIDTVVDFIGTYADRTHHGKEEDILFRDLAQKHLTKEHALIMGELLEEHSYARKTVKKLVAAKKDYIRTGAEKAVSDMIDLLTELTEFYPKHIEKEDKHFFFPCMKYFSDDEQQAMLAEFRAFDGKMIHEKYGKLVESFGE